jgi:hypothetical protein
MRGFLKEFCGTAWELQMAPEGHFIVYLCDWRGMTGNRRDLYLALARDLNKSRIHNLPALIETAEETWRTAHERWQDKLSVLVFLRTGRWIA